MQFHHVRLVDDDALPPDHDWAVVEHDGQITVFIKEHALTPRKLEEAWAGYRQLTRPRHPRPRLVSARRAPMMLRAPAMRAEAGHLRVMTAVALAAYGVPAMKIASVF